MATTIDATKTVIQVTPETWVLDGWPHGDTLDITFESVEDEDGNPVDLTGGYTAEMRFEERNGDEVVTIDDAGGEIIFGNGTLQIRVETTAWPNNCDIYSDFQAITPSGNTETWFNLIVKLKKTTTLPT